MYNITILGGQGSGKGTQVPIILEYFKEKNDLNYITTGGLCRDTIASGSKLGLLVDSYINKGDLLPNEHIFKMLESKLESLGNIDGVLFDGIPRTLEQAKSLDNLLTKFESKIDLAINIDVPIKALVKRITGRRVCPKCKKNYHINFIPPKKEGICDIDGATLTQRKDDADENAVKQRLSIFETNNSVLPKSK